MKEVNKWGEILAAAEKKGKPLSAIDTLIAATAQVHDLSVVTSAD
jgi:toxin FitB